MGRPKTVQQAERMAYVLRARSRGEANLVTAKKLGISPQRCSQIYQDALQSVVSEGAEDARKVETEHLMELRRRAMKILGRTHLVVNQGHIVGKNTIPFRDLDGVVLRDDKGAVLWDPEGFIPLEDDDPALRAIAQLVRISESYRKLHGYDAPQKLEITDENAVDTELQAGIDALVAALQNNPVPLPAKAET